MPRLDEDVWRAFAKAKAILLCDDYPVNIDRDAIDALASEHGVEVKWTEPRADFFRVPIDLKGEQDGAATFAACRNIDNCPHLRDGRIYPCGRIACINAFREHYGVKELEQVEGDSISIYDVRDPWEIMDFLLNPVPWCRHCDYKRMYRYPWQRGVDSLEQWTESGPDAGCCELASSEQSDASSTES